MNYKFFPHTEENVSDMLDKIGVKSLEDLFKEIPEEVRFRGEYDIPGAKSEIEIRQFFNQLGAKTNNSLALLVLACTIITRHRQFHPW